MTCGPVILLTCRCALGGEAPKPPALETAIVEPKASNKPSVSRQPRGVYPQPGGLPTTRGVCPQPGGSGGIPPMTCGPVILLTCRCALGGEAPKPPALETAIVEPKALNKPSVSRQPRRVCPQPGGSAHNPGGLGGIPPMTCGPVILLTCRCALGGEAPKPPALETAIVEPKASKQTQRVATTPESLPTTRGRLTQTRGVCPQPGGSAHNPGGLGGYPP